jgi:hypothetical protein
MGFSELDTWRRQLADEVYPKPIMPGVAPPVPRAAQHLQRVERIISSHIDDSAEAALERAGRSSTAYADAKRVFASLKTASDAANKTAAARLGNRAVSITDYATGLSSMVGGAAAAGPIGAAAGIPMTLAHRWLRENGRAVTAVALRRASQALQGEVQHGVSLFSKALGAAQKTAIKAPPRMANLAREIGHGAANEVTRWNERKKALDRMTQLEQGATLGDALTRMKGIPAGLSTVLSQVGGDRVGQLMRDLPKPRFDIRGMSQLSRQDIALANAMYEATFDPMSIFEDYRNGQVNYDKTQYVWKQYPGFLRYCQSAVVDMFTSQMSDDQKRAMPDPALTQIDYFFNFNGKLQESISGPLSRTFTGAAVEKAQSEQNKPNLSAPLALPTAKRTMTQRMMRM